MYFRSRIALVSIAGAVGFSACQSGPPLRRSGSETRSPAGPGAAPSAEAPAALPPFKTFAVYSDQTPRRTHYVPSGYMGDSDLTMSGAYAATPHGPGTCLRVGYAAKGPKGWS